MYTVAKEMLGDIKKLLKENYPDTNLDVVDRAYEFAKRAHGGQFRLSGRPHLDHAVATGKILASWRMPLNLVVSGILHDISEDTVYTLEDIKKSFGQDIRDIIEGETKLSTLHYHGRERYAENLRRMFFAIAKDVRVVIVKCADRIDNLKTLNFFPEEKQKRIALETLEIYAPIANRLGMGAIRGELEDLSFKYVYPQEYEWTLNLVIDKVHEREEYLEDVRKELEKEFTKNKMRFISVHGRVKHLYSLYQKLLRRNRDISQIYDLVALRIIVPSVQDCYSALGIIHQRWVPLKGRVKDYVALPKPNGYQSLHTTVFCDKGEIIELQIRTPQMHEEAEFGIAAHWFYSERGKKSQLIDQHTQWLKELVKLQKNIQDRKAFLQTVDSLKIDIFQNRIFIFTPKGDVIDLPEGATPVDFAYAIHSTIGDHCTQSLINSNIAPLSTPLQSGDVVQIIIDKKRAGPSADWLEFVKTSHARDRIRENARKTKLPGWLRELVQKKHKSVTR